MEHKINDIIKLTDGRTGKILGTPSGFLSNGAYEVEVPNNRGGKERLWVKEEQILYQIDTKWVDDINNYFEVIYDENGVNIIPKGLVEVNVDDENEEIKMLVFKLDGSEVHGNIIFHIGNTNVWSSTNPKPEPKEEPKKHDLL